MILAGTEVGVVALLHFVTRRKAAASEHHSARRMHFDRLAAPVEHCTGHPALLPKQPGRRRREKHGHPALLQRQGEARDQRVAVRNPGAPGMADTVDEVTGQEAADAQSRAKRTGHAQEVRHVFARNTHAAHDHRGLERAAQTREVRAEPAAIEVVHPQGTPARHRVADFRVVVRPGRGERVRQVAVCFEEIEHVRSVFEERLRDVTVEAVAHLVLKIGERGLARVLDTRPPGMRAAGYPDDPGRHRGGAAENRLLFRHHDIEPEMGGADRGTQAPCPRAEDQHVAVLSRRVPAHPVSHPPSTYRVVPVM